MKSFETLIGGSGAHGERPKTSQHERGALHAPIDGKKVVLGAEEVAAFRAHLAQVRASANEELHRAGSVYESTQGPATSPKSVDYALQEKIQQGHVLIEGTPEGDRLRQLRDQLKRQIPAHPTQQTGGLFQRVRNLFR